MGSGDGSGTRTPPKYWEGECIKIDDCRSPQPSESSEEEESARASQAKRSQEASFKITMKTACRFNP